MINRYLIKAVFDDNIMKRNEWFFKADWENAEIASLETKSSWLRIKNIIWYSGTWKDGVWKEGTWEDGTWKDGIWDNGTWKNGTWENGIWERGIWYNGTWQYGVWRNGLWKSGFWRDGTWKGGEWLKGKIFNLKTNKYIESKVPPNECKWSLSYGK